MFLSKTYSGATSDPQIPFAHIALIHQDLPLFYRLLHVRILASDASQTKTETFEGAKDFQMSL